jgi:excisionase family DNA binding protein
MSNPLQNSDSLLNEVQSGNRRGRITVPEIAQRLDIGRLKVYAMLEQGILPGVRVGRQWIVTRHAYSEWERTCGARSGTGFQAQPEVRVVT